ncbi:Reticulon-like protein B21 [Raphanus sativus]|uniref:Reticulon-like protein n=1 Tax=Raphanus sativus TaxID=3726 RepID=A0A9W3D418_RAPSA|nr:reticulon-like protein B21 [Raphanus sativus]XP_056858573.1 reticulon-like protein B21 [Raphanus sativus]KAJ4911129.1 Reticulon-like protein B21 [Raphanus sativus]
MDPSISRRRRIGVGGAVIAVGSVLETRMQSDEEVSSNKAIVKKTIHLHAPDEDNKNSTNKQMILKEASLVGVNGKRRACKTDGKSPSNEINRGDSLKLTRPRSIGSTPPVTPRRSAGPTTPMTPPKRSISSDVNDKTLTVFVGAKKERSDSVEGVEKKTPGRFKKTRSEICTAVVNSGEFDSVPLRKVNSLPAHGSDKTNEKTEDVHVETEDTVVQKQETTEEVKEFDVGQEIVVNHEEKEEEEDDDHKEDQEEEEEEVEKQSVDVKEMNVAKQSSENRVGVVESKKYSQFHNRTAPSPSSVRKVPPPVYSVPPSKEEEDNFTHPQSKLQSLEDLVMWRDASRSTLVFGFGTFLIISSSYASDLNFSFISVVAYMGLIYLGVMFLFNAVIRRGIVEEEEERHKGAGVREEDVKRILRFIMPYLNESLLQLRALFSGDPSTTLKMGVVLYILARCGSSITLWNLAKFGFLGAFTVPKIFISYSTHFSAYGIFWVRRFRDAWETCNHKKAVALALFTLVWNLSSVVARVWAAFMLFVAFRYYQQNMIWTTDQDDDYEEEYEADDQEEEEVPKLKRDPYMMMMPNKLKKVS